MAVNWPLSPATAFWILVSDPGDTATGLMPMAHRVGGVLAFQ
jgi:hypothetical protein